MAVVYELEAIPWLFYHLNKYYSFSFAKRQPVVLNDEDIQMILEFFHDFRRAATKKIVK